MNLKNNKTLFFPLALVIYEIAVYASNDMYLPALVQMQKDFQTTPELAQGTVVSFILGSSVMQIFIGILSDKIGRRPIVLATGCLFILSTIFCALINHINPFLVARFVQGSVISGIFVAGYAAIHELLETKKAINTLAWMYGITILAPAFGPIAGSALLTIVDSWRDIFWFIAIVGSIAVVGLYFTMPETLKKSTNKQSSKPKFSNYAEILKNKNFLTYSIISSLYIGNSLAWITTGPVLTYSAFHLNEKYFGVFQVIIFGFYILGTKLVSKITKTKSPQQLIMIATNIMFLAIFPLIAHLYWWTKENNLLIIALSISAFASGLSGSSLQRLAMEETEHGSGTKMAVFSTLTGIFMTAYSLIVTKFYDTTTKPITILVTISILVGFILAQRLKHHGQKNG